MLNKSQLNAVKYNDGPLLIVAGAGTGKTTVITQKIAHLIKGGLAKPEEILAVTFTDKAATEMLERVDQELDVGYSDLQISTFHAFCQRLLEHHGLEIGISNQFKLLTPTDAWLLVRRNLNKFNLDYYRPLGNPTRHIHELIKHFSKCKDELISPEEYLRYAESVKLDGDNVEFVGKEKKRSDNLTMEQFNNLTMDSLRLSEIANAYHVYNQLLLDNNCLDFGDLIYYSVKLLEKRPNVLAALRERYKYVLVDEFQDVNWAQYCLIKLLSNVIPTDPPMRRGAEGSLSNTSDFALKRDSSTSPSTRSARSGSARNDSVAHLTVVGDDDQSIYAFRGASVSNILRFKDDFPRAKEIVLTDNYRSGQEILDLAYKSIQNNNPDRLESKLKIEKNLKSELRNLKSTIEHIHCGTLEDEVAEVVKKISDIHGRGLAGWDDIAILVRANSHAGPFIAALERARIPYEFLASVGLFRQPIVLDCFNFLKAIDSYHESSAVYRLLRMPFLNFSDDDLQKLTYTADRKSISLFTALKSARELKVSSAGAAVCDLIVNCVQTGMNEARQSKPTAVLVNFLEKSGYFKYLTKEENVGNQEVIRQIRQLHKFFEELKNYEEMTPGAHVKDLVEHCQLLLESGDEGAMPQTNEANESVSVITIHKAKGLEFKYVFVVNLVEDHFPSRRRGEAMEIPLALVRESLPEGDFHIQEERRLFYVAITRAKDGLFLTSATDYGGARAKKISRFLDELGFATDKKDTTEKEGLSHITYHISHNRTETQTSGTKINYEIPSTLSYSKINSYLRCPYQYKLAYILEIPTKGSASLSFGQSMHSAMQKFYQRVIELNSVKQNSLFGMDKLEASSSMTPSNGVKAPSFDELLQIYEKSWTDDWYQDQNQREKYFQKGKDILRAFYESQEGKWTIPAALESWFKVKVGECFINGRIDRVDRLPDGGLEIIDYKTGQAKEKVVGDDKNQLLIYQLAAQSLPEYKNLGAVAKLSYFYLENNKRTEFLGDEKELDDVKEKISAAVERIKAQDFTASPGAHVCGYCDYRDICEYRRL
ncbi:MAG: ATP-dependent helicase [Candidatus Magasanikbacteria bacterium]|nr:ATP-dependent helicase [Candidatus Magasanikbacteria bacterium]